VDERHLILSQVW